MNSEYFKDKKYNIYFYDAEHTHETQYKAIEYYYDSLEESFILIVDDWNDSWVKTGTFDAIKDLNLITHKDWELPSNGNGDLSGWWNGVYVAVMSKK